MRKKYVKIGCIVAGLLMIWISAQSQSKRGYTKEKWKVSDPFEQKVFIENNEGQFDGKAGVAGDKVLYNTCITGIEVYFTATGIIYRSDKYTESRRELEEGEGAVVQTQTFSEKWEGANKSVEIIAEDEVTFYYCYPQGNKHTTIAHAFKKLLYKNLYKGIDVEYSFKDDRKGMEYRIIVHPGGDLSKVMLSYPNAEGISKKADGGIEIKSSMGLFKDEAVEKTYYKETGKTVEGQYLLNGNTESFIVGSYDHNKTLTIDPFKVNPAMTGYNAGYDVCYDLNGNVYAYGSYLPFQEVKISNTGTLLWTFNAVFPVASGQYADFAVDEVNGTSYLSNAGYPMILKVNTLGKQLDSFNFSTQMNELWRMAYNRCENQIILGGGGTAGNYQLATLDTSLLTFNPLNVLGTAGGHHDVSLLCIDNTNGYCYMATSQSNASNSWDNTLVKCPLPSFLPLAFSAQDKFSFYEGPTINYIDGVSGHTDAMNGIVATPNRVFMYDGAKIRGANKNTGVIVDSVQVSSTKFSWGGIDADICDNIYVGNDTLINVYDSAMALTGTIYPGYQVYDLRIMPNNQLCACGKGWVSAYTISVNTMSISKTRTNAGCGTTNGTATAKLAGCGSDSSQYSYLWSNGATTQQDTGLAPGTYTVTISSGCDFKFMDTITIKGGTDGGMSLTINQKNVNCYGDSNGSATVTVIGGKSPYKYDWTPLGGTSANANGLKAGNYMVTVYDSSGCNTANVTITQPAKLIPTITQKDILCNGLNDGSIIAAIGGGTTPYKYLWSPSGSTNDSIINLTAGKYVVTVTDTNGCTIKDSSVITQPPTFFVTMSSNNPTCYGANDGSTTVSVSGGTSPYKYSWSSGGTNASLANIAAGTYIVTITDKNGCNFKDSVSLMQPAKFIPAVSGNDTICVGKNTTLTATGGGTYLWNTGSTNSSINVNPVSTTTYTVHVTNGFCTRDTTFTVSVRPSPAFKTGNDSICSGDSTILTVSGGVTYNWLAPLSATNASVVVKPFATTKYSVVVTSLCGVDTLSQVVNVTATPKISFSGNTNICSGKSTTITASGGSSYTWTPATGLSCTNCPNPTASPTVNTTYTLTVSNGKCVSDTTLTITVNTINPTITNPPKICQGDSTTICATGGGTYVWNTGATTSCITVKKSGSYSVIINNGCIDSVKTTLLVDIPNLDACCDTTMQAGDKHTIYASGQSNYSWSPATGLSCTNCPNPVATPTVTTTYTVTSLDTAGCPVERTVTIYVETLCADFEMPNIFTPNDDGRNDDFVPIYYDTRGAMHNGILNPASYNINIYDRWGVLVYSSNDPGVFWNGNIKNGNYQAPPGVYYYIIKATCDNNTYDKRGFVHLIR